LHRLWKPGDRVSMTFDMPVRLVKDPGGSGQIAFVRGPVVLSLERRLLPTELGSQPLKALADDQGVVTTAKVRDTTPKNFQLVVDVPFVTADGSTVFVPMCDYASAGRTWSKESALQVWLPQPLNLEETLIPDVVWAP